MDSQASGDQRSGDDPASTEPHLDRHSETDPPVDSDTESDPGLDDEQGSDWASEGGAVEEGPATKPSDADEGPTA